MPARIARLLGFALAAFLLIQVWMRLVILGPSFVFRTWYGFTEGGTMSTAEALRRTFVVQPWYRLRGQFRATMTWPRFPTLDRYYPLTWRLESPDSLIRSEAFEDLRSAPARTKRRVARWAAKQMTPADAPRFQNHLEILKATGLSGAVALPVLWTAIDQLVEYKGPVHDRFHYPRCGNEIRLEYESADLLRGSDIIRVILAVDPVQKAELVKRLQLLSHTNPDLQYFCAREIRKLIGQPAGIVR
jgi:hypothetical protein